MYNRGLSFIQMFIVTACALLAATANAASFSLSPLRLDVSTKQKTAQIRITNNTNTPMNIQAQAMAWEQIGTEEIYSDTKDILVSPPIITVPAGKDKVVRIRLRRAPDVNKELSYRVYFQELPGSQQQTQTTGANFRVRFGVPLFVAPVKLANSNLKVESTLPSDTELRVAVENMGNHHIRVLDARLFSSNINKNDPKNITDQPLALTVQSEQNNSYVLPSKSLSWLLKLENRLADGQYLLLLKTNIYRDSNLQITPEGLLWQEIAIRDGQISTQNVLPARKVN